MIYIQAAWEDMKLSIADWICCGILASEADPGAAPSLMALRAGRSSRKYVRRYINTTPRPFLVSRYRWVFPMRSMSPCKRTAAQVACHPALGDAVFLQPEHLRKQWPHLPVVKALDL